MLAIQTAAVTQHWLLLPLQPIPVIVTTDVRYPRTIHTDLQNVRTALPAVDWGTLAWGRLSRDLQTAVQVLIMCSALLVLLAAAVTGSHDTRFCFLRVLCFCGAAHYAALMSMSMMVQESLEAVVACTYHEPLCLAAYSAAFDDSLPLRLQRFESVRETLLGAVRAALAAVMQDCEELMDVMVGAAVAAQSPGRQVVLHTALTCKVPVQ